MIRRHLFARIALGIALAAILWTAMLLVQGGFDTRVLGIRIRTNDPLRPFLIALATISLFIGLVGDDTSDTAMSSVLDFLDRPPRITARMLAVTLAVAIGVIGLRWGAKAAGGSDSYGYISQAELWLSGGLEISQPWIDQVPWPDAEQTFAPLGYRPGRTRTTITPTYSPGLPMLMALAKRIGGHCAIFWVVPLAGAVLVLATFAIGRRVGGSFTGVIAAWLLATSPAFLFMLLAQMSDVPAAAAWAVTFWCVTTGRLGSALAGGVVASLAVLIRPNLAPMACLPALWFVLEARAEQAARRPYLWQLAAYLAGLIPGVAITAALNQFRYGSPLVSGYGALPDIFSFRNVLPNLLNYARWLSQTQTPVAFFGIAALLVPVGWLWAPQARRSTVPVLGIFVVAVLLEYCAYRTFGAWWDLRFLLPAFGFMMIGIAVFLLRVARPGLTHTRRGTRVPVAGAVTFVAVLLGWHGVSFVRRTNVFDQQRVETKYPEAAKIVATRTPTNAVVFSGLHTGSVRYYAGRVTLTYASLDPAWLEPALAWLNAHGAHPYALLEDWEIKEFTTRFSTSRAGALGMPPLVFYDGGAKIYLFDLLRPSGSSEPTETIADPAPEARCVAPAPTPSLMISASPVAGQR